MAATARIIPLVKPSLFDERSTWVPADFPGARSIQIPDAPADGLTYGRLNNAWEPVVPLAGATMRGRLFLIPNEPTHPLEAVSKGWVDRWLKVIDAGRW